VPLHARIGAAAVDAVGTAVDGAAAVLQRRVHDGQANGPTRCRQQVHAEGVGQAALVARGFLQVLAFAEYARAIGDARTLSECPAVAHGRVEEVVARGSVGAEGVTAVD